MTTQGQQQINTTIAGDGRRHFSATPKKRRRVCNVAVVAGLSAAMVGGVADIAQAFQPTDSATIWYIHENDPTYSGKEVAYVQPGKCVYMAASGTVSDGWWFHGADGPEGWVGNVAGLDYPQPRAWTGALLYRLSDDLGWRSFGSSHQAWICNDRVHWQTLLLDRNDNHPGNGSGYFWVTVWPPR